MTQPTTASPPASRRRHQRTAALSLAVALVVASLGLAAGPAGAAVPGAPKILDAVGYNASVRVYFAPATDDGGSPITGYEVERLNGMVIEDTIPVTNTAPVIVTSGMAATDYGFRVRAKNADGYGPYSAIIVAKWVAGITDYSKFGAPATAQSTFIRRMYNDLLDRDPSIDELAVASAALTGGQTASEFIDGIVNGAERVNSRHPVIRLYFAYFKRGPDHGGLDFWVNARKNGKTINDESNAFARSNEFKTTYGSLDNTEFVTLVYKNVLDRDPEQGGFEFWVGQLDDGLVTRGRVMTQFSESNEFKNSSRGRTLAADVYDDLYDKAISVGGLRDWGAHIQGGGTAGGLATYLINAAGYPAS